MQIGKIYTHKATGAKCTLLCVTGDMAKICWTEYVMDKNGKSVNYAGVVTEVPVNTLDMENNGSVIRPIVVCLCGSTRFYDEFQKAYFEETMAGKIVLSVGFYQHSSAKAHGENIEITPEQKKALDELHKRKIDISNEILVINVGGYIGESTRNEIKYAKSKGKLVRYLENNK